MSQLRILCDIAGMSLLFVGPTFLFMNVEGWYMMDAIYYCFVTLSTIGFGDFIPGNTLVPGTANLYKRLVT